MKILTLDTEGVQQSGRIVLGFRLYHWSMPISPPSHIGQGLFLHDRDLLPHADPDRRSNQKLATFSLDGCTGTVSFYDWCSLPAARAFTPYSDPAKRWCNYAVCQKEIKRLFTRSYLEQAGSGVARNTFKDFFEIWCDGPLYGENRWWIHPFLLRLSMLSAKTTVQ